MRWAVGIVLAAAVVQLGWQAWRGATRYADSQRNPYVYAHTLSGLLDLVDMVEGLTAQSPDGPRTVIKVMAEGGDYWPLPWYLRSFESTGWYADVPGDIRAAAAPIIIASPRFEGSLRKALGQRELALGLFGLRPGVFLQLHVEQGLWERYLNRGSPPKSAD